MYHFLPSQHCYSVFDMLLLPVFGSGMLCLWIVVMVRPSQTTLHSLEPWPWSVSHSSDSALSFLALSLLGQGVPGATAKADKL